MSISVREMEVFRRVMDGGSVTAAASALRISQPAVSRILQQAEARLGFPLFVREKKRLLPTAEAHALFVESTNVFSAIEIAQRLAVELRAGHAGIITIAAIPGFANSIVPEVVHRFRAGRPDVSVVLQHLNALEVIARVAQGRANLGLAIGPVGNKGIETTTLCEAELGCVLPPGHPLTAKRELRAADFEGIPLICPSPQLPVGAAIVTAFAEANVRLRIDIEASMSTISCALVRAGAGVAILDGFGLLSARAQDLVTRPFRPRVSSVARLLRPTLRPVSRLEQEFIAILRQVIAESGFRSPGTTRSRSKRKRPASRPAAR